jgi:hypothetical protein
MKRICIILGAWLALFGQAPAYGQTFEPFNQLKVESSLPLQFATNTLHTTTAPRSDFFASPSFKLSAIEIVDPTLNYRIYVATNPDAYPRVTTADDGAVTVGGRFDKTLGNFNTGGIYNHTLAFDGIYRTLLFQANDFASFVGYTYDNNAGLTIQPSAMATYRVTDLPAQDRFLLTLKADVTRTFMEKLSFTLTPTLRYYAFDNGTSAGRRDFFPSLVGAVSYKINDDLSVGGSVEYDRRSSNVAAANYENWIFLASVTYGHTFSLSNPPGSVGRPK